MKTEDVKVGETYLTLIGDTLARVVVVQRRQGCPARDTMFGRKPKERDTFDVRRENEDRVLPKPRSAAALREIPNFNTWHVVSDEVGTVLAVYGSALLDDANKKGCEIIRSTGAATYLHSIRCSTRPSVGQSISMKGAVTKIELPHGTMPARLDVDGQAKPLSTIVGHALGGSLQGPGITVPDTYRTEDNSIPLK